MDSPGEPIVLWHGLNLQYIHAVLKKLETSAMSDVKMHIDQQSQRMQAELLIPPLSTLQQITKDALGQIGISRHLVFLANYSYDRLVAALELTYKAPDKEWDFATTWNHQHNRALAWRYGQQCLILRKAYTEVQLRAGQLLLKDVNLQQLLCKIAEVEVKLHQVKKIQEVLKNA